jgi:hypothetical protein
MVRSEYEAAPRTLIDAISRDMVISVLFAGICYGLQQWHGATGSWVSLGAGSIISFVLGFIFIYLSHEWGHYLGARLAGANIPLGSGKGVFLGLFDPALYSRRQFLWMAMGGEVGYFVPALIFLPVFWSWPPLQGLAVASAAFVVQALSVDVPVLWKIRKGADIQTTLTEGTAAPVILRKTGISWPLLAICIAAMAFLF